MKDGDNAKEKHEKGGEAEKIGEKERTGKEKEKKEKRKSGLKAAIAAIFAVVLVGILLYSVSLTNPQNSKNPYQMKFANETLNFRADLGKAMEVPVFPDAESVRRAILSEKVSMVRVSYVPDEKYNAFYAADSFEISYKLVILFKYYYGISGYFYEGDNSENCIFFEETGRRICILSQPVASEGGITAGDAEFVVFLSAANETSVRLKDNVIYISGMDFSEKDRKYTDLDLAADRFLTALMGQQ